ncbi:MAG: hypothetical protein C4527_01630 [Candidatus Omnitrophota bacterium]|nr:MAG: hypothetical protein C4527_01630 [Candidatus Omnitrophota bacterium]
MVNEMYRFTGEGVISTEDEPIFREIVETLVTLLSPFAPHLCDELWETIGRKGYVLEQQWPLCNPEFLAVDTMTVIIQVNGKVRGKVDVSSDANEEVIWNAAQQDPLITRWFTDKAIRKKIYVPGKLMNIVV